MEIVPDSLFLNYPVSTALLIIGTVVVAAVGTITFYLGKWTL